MPQVKLWKDLQPAVAGVLQSLRQRGYVSVDSHKIADEFESLFPADYTHGLTVFKGSHKLFHGYLSRMLFAQRFGTVNHIGFVKSTNRKKRPSKNSKWYI